MISPLELGLYSLIRQAYSVGLARHGELDISVECFSDHIVSIIEKHNEPTPTQAAALSFFKGLHTDDLYLAIACAESKGVAWSRIYDIYKEPIRHWVRSIYGPCDEIDEIASDIMSDLFMPDGSGSSRIASYDGRWSLATWLHAVVKNRALNYCKRRCNGDEPLDSLPYIVDGGAFDRIEAALGVELYGRLIWDALDIAGRKLDDEERSILLMRYDEQMPAVEVARKLGMHPSDLSRKTKRIQNRFGKSVRGVLAFKHGLPDAAVDECIREIRETPYYSLLEVLKRQQASVNEPAFRNDEGFQEG
ncbi:MAG: sigma-70 family RNA polymerase sigma factor [Blastocatellia bacterium]|nr:sigma-70 family RNA polymerase sigma factor [Blastocatellia bacterium]